TASDAALRATAMTRRPSARSRATIAWPKSPVAPTTTASSPPVSFESVIAVLLPPFRRPGIWPRSRRSGRGVRQQAARLRHRHRGVLDHVFLTRDHLLVAKLDQDVARRHAETLGDPLG